MSWRDDVAALPSFAPAEFDLDAARTALVIVDMQYVDAHRDHGLGKSLRETHPAVWDYYFTRVEQLVVPNVGLLLAASRERSMRVVHLTVGPVLPDGADLLPLRQAKAAPGLKSMLYNQGTFEHQILEELAPLEDELVINKTSRGAFNSTAIERTLINLGIDALVVAGVSTSSCVETTARDAADRGFRTVIVEDATAEIDEASHDATLRQFAHRWGRVWTTEETLAVLQELRAPLAQRVGP